MDSDDNLKLKQVWHQGKIPVLLRRGEGYALQVRLLNHLRSSEFSHDQFRFLRSIRPTGHAPKWLTRYKSWELPQSWFNDLVGNILRVHGKLYIIQPYREQEVCAPACMNASGHECQCSCMGANHGAGGPDGAWFVVSDTFATRSGDSHLACRLMTKVP